MNPVSAGGGLPSPVGAGADRPAAESGAWMRGSGRRIGAVGPCGFPVAPGGRPYGAELPTPDDGPLMEDDDAPKEDPAVEEPPGIDRSGIGAPLSGTPEEGEDDGPPDGPPMLADDPPMLADGPPTMGDGPS